LASGKTGNSLLDGFPPHTLSRLQPLLTTCELPVGREIHVPGKRLEYAFFPTGGRISVVASMEDGTAVEIDMAGREGMFSVASILGDDEPAHRAMVQLPGQALRMKIHLLREQMAADLEMQRRLLLYAYGVLAAVSQSAACNRLHLLEQRCARWLLTARDSAEGDTFPMTHEFLAMMLGVRRAGVTVAAQTLQSDGLITYSHGKMTIADRQGLEARSCECYRAVKAEFYRLLGTPAS
jgi:CRP-like cAMP-binding protein